MNLNPTPAPVWLSETGVRTLVTDARRARDTMLRMIAEMDAKVLARQKSLVQDFQGLDAKTQRAAIDGTVATLKATLKTDSAEKRTAILKQLVKANQTARAAMEFYDNPVGMLLRTTIASTKRVTIFQNLEAAGDTELKAFASLAVAGKDADMASAVISRLHKITPSSARPVSPASIADALIGELQREMLLALMEVDSILTEAVQVNRLFEQGKSGSNGIGAAGTSKIALALKKRNEAAVNGKRVVAESDGDGVEDGSDA